MTQPRSERVITSVTYYRRPANWPAGPTLALVSQLTYDCDTPGFRKSREEFFGTEGQFLGAGSSPLSYTPNLSTDVAGQVACADDQSQIQTMSDIELGLALTTWRATP
jgi:hypothetical protein